MLFDINNYNIYLAFGIFSISLIILYLIFRKYVTSLLDPIFMHLIWISSLLSFMVTFLERNSASLSYISIVLSIFIYLFSLIVFFEKNSRDKAAIINKNIAIKQYSKTKIKVLLFLVLILFFLSKFSFFDYATTAKNFAELVNFRFEELQGRNPIERIISIGANPFLYFFLFRMIQYNLQRRINILILLLVTIIGFLSGGRSSLVNLLFSIGFYIFFFRSEFTNNALNKINNKAPFFLVISLGLAAFISGFYGDENSRSNGMDIIINRIFASHDGIEYYLKYNGEDNLKTGIEPYLLSIFGVYIKQFLTLEYKNIGWQLSELALGTDLTFAQGANYTFLLQGIVLLSYFAPFYAFFIAWIFSKMRYAYTTNTIKTPLYYGVSSISLVIVHDAEYFFLQLISIFLVYIFIVYPILRIKV